MHEETKEEEDMEESESDNELISKFRDKIETDNQQALTPEKKLKPNVGLDWLDGMRKVLEVN